MHHPPSAGVVTSGAWGGIPDWFLDHFRNPSLDSRPSTGFSTCASPSPATSFAPGPSTRHSTAESAKEPDVLTPRGSPLEVRWLVGGGNPDWLLDHLLDHFLDLFLDQPRDLPGTLPFLPPNSTAESAKGVDATPALGGCGDIGCLCLGGIPDLFP